MSNLEELATSTKNYTDEEDDVIAWALEDFEIGECLGNGKFGYVYRAVEKTSNKECAIKVICKKIVNQFNFYEQLKHEIEIHTRLTHKNIVRLYGYFYDNNYVYLIYEFVKMGSLFQYIKNKTKIEEREAAYFTYDIALALSYIKKRNIVHRDLKLENVMIAQEEDCLNSDNSKIKRDKYLKLADFGWACQFFSEKRKTLCGTPEYLAPEMANSLPYDFGVDIWSLGIMTYEMVTGCSPFSGPNCDILENIKSYQKIESILDHLREIEASHELVDFLSRLLLPDCSKRIQVEEIFKHSWIMKNVENN